MNAVTTSEIRPIAAIEPNHLQVVLRSKNLGTEKILNNAIEDNFIDGKNRWYEFDFFESVYIQEVRIHVSGYNSFDEMTLRISSINGKNIEFSNKPNDGVFVFQVKKFATGFKFRPGVKWTLFNRHQIKNVEIIGYEQASFESLQDEIGTIISSRSDLLARIENVSLLEKDINKKVDASQTRLDTLKSENSALELAIEKASSKVTGLNAEIATLEKRRDDLSASVGDLQKTIENLRNKRRTEETLISEKQSQLTRLTEKLRLFPSEISGFVEEARRSIQWYSILLVIPLIIISYATYYVFSNAVYLTQITNNKDVNLWNIFVSRLPFVIVTVSIFQVCGALIKRWLDEIYSINNQRLNLSAISIVAKDVSVASASSLDISSAEKFELETKL
jgi:prefoldin subunit 5